MMRTIAFFALGLVLAGPYSASVSAGWEEYTHVLPQYCKNTAKRGEGWREQCRKSFGDACGDLHHYCKGLYAEYEAKLSVKKRRRDYWLKMVIDQMRYTSGRCKPGCALYPQLHTRWGWALREKTGDSAGAIKHYQLAIQAKPTYTPAYARLADLYNDLRLPAEAREVLEAGLKVQPGSRGLQRRLGKLETSQ